jgi:hypothetical protein
MTLGVGARALFIPVGSADEYFAESRYGCHIGAIGAQTSSLKALEALEKLRAVQITHQKSKQP